MTSIVDSALAFPATETPVAAPQPQVQQTDKTSTSDTGESFAVKLKDFEEKELSEIQPETQGGDTEKKDNGMPDNICAMGAIYGIVGILEGFEPPGYQQDNTVCIEEQNIEPVAPQPAAQQSGSGQGIVIQTPAQGKDSNGLPEQIAWTLQTSDVGAKPMQTQEEILKIVGEYLDSLENTNNNGTSGAANGQATASDIQSATPVNTPVIPADKTAEAAADKTAADTVTAQVLPEEAVVQAGAKAVTAAAAEAGKGPAPAEAVTVEAKPEQAVKPEIKASDIPEPSVTGEAVPAASVDSKAVTETAAAAPQKPDVKPETVKENVLRIVDRVKTGVSEGKYDFDIDLKPDFMGKVSIKLTMKDGSVSVEIKADDAAVKGMFSDQMPSMHSMLKEKGIPVSTIDVTFSGDMTPGREENYGQSDGRNRGGNMQYGPAPEAAFETAREKYDFYLGGSLVEFLA